MRLAEILWNPYMLGILFIVCLYFHYVEKGVVVRTFRQSLKVLRRCMMSKGDYSSKQIIMNSLGAVMGLGNIIGVATAIIMGGIGSIFYMFISGLIVTSLKYAEIKCSVEYHGGAPYYIKTIFGSKWMAILYTCVFLASSMIMGTAIVSKTTADILYLLLDIPIKLTVLMLTGIVLICVLINYRKVMEYNEILVPYMIILFSIVCIGGCIWNVTMFMNSVKKILLAAFDIKAFLYGNGYAMLRYGIARGFFSNEAGFGTSTLLHGHSTMTPHEEAMLGVHEVLIDTNFMCVLVGILLVMSNVYHENAVMYVILAFHALFPHIGIPFVTIMILFFGMAAILGWFVIGKECVLFLSHSRIAQICYVVTYAICILIAGFVNLEVIFKYSDLCNALMLWINVIVLFKIYK